MEPSRLTILSSASSCNSVADGQASLHTRGIDTSELHNTTQEKLPQSKLVRKNAPARVDFLLEDYTLRTQAVPQAVVPSLYTPALAAILYAL